MKEFLWKTFVKDYENYKDPLVRGTVTYSPRMLETGVHAALEGLRTGKTRQKEIIIKSEIVTAETAAKYYFPDSVY